MRSLNPNWLTEGIIDFEYKKYLLLAYLQFVGKQFNENRLYPFMADLVEHYNNVVSIKNKKEMVSSRFPKKLSKLDFEKFKLKYEQLLEDDKFLAEIEEILDFAIPQMQVHLDEGKEIYDFIEDQLEIYPVGVQPLKSHEGYMFLRSGNTTDTEIYEYSITLFENAREKYRGIKTEYITKYQVSLSNTFEHIKRDLLKVSNKFANPATFAVECDISIPLVETFLPIAKRCIVRRISR